MRFQKKNIEIEFHVLVYEKNNIGSIFDVNLVVPDSMQKSRILYYVNKYFKIRKQYRYIIALQKEKKLYFFFIFYFLQCYSDGINLYFKATTRKEVLN